MAQQRQINYGISFNVDQSGLDTVKASLAEIQRLTGDKLIQINPNLKLSDTIDQLTKVKATANTVQEALDKAFNQKLGTLNLTEFNSSLSSAGLNLKQVYTQFSSIGAIGQQAFRNLTTELLTTNLQLKQTHSLLDNMATTMGNTIKWGIASSVMNNFTGAVSKAYNYVVKLDTSLNDIRIVTEKSAEEMSSFAIDANKAAQRLGSTTRDFTEAALIYYQQGLSDEEAKARAEVTIKAANVTGQTGQEVSEQLTAVWNGYKVTADEAELYVDKLAAVAATTAADLEELSTGMSKVASAANSMGVPVDSLNAQLATIVSVTRQAPESVGTALRTIYARMGDIEAGLDEETTLGNYTEQMKSLGVNVLDINGNLRDMGDIITEVGNKWNTMSREQQVALAQTMAGTRQYNNLLALFGNWDMYNEALKTSQNAVGTLQKQQDIYMESTQAHLDKMRAAFENLYDSVLDEDTVKDFADIIGGIANAFANLIDAIGGGGNALLAFGSIATRIFSKNLAQGLATTINNFKALRENTQQTISTFQVLQELKSIGITDAATNEIIEWKKQIMDLGNVVTTEQNNEANAIIKTRNELAKEAEQWEITKQKAQQFIQENTDKNININFSNVAVDTEDFDEIVRVLDTIDTQVETTDKEIKGYQQTIKSTIEKESEYLDTLEDEIVDNEKIKKVTKEKDEAYKKLKSSISNVREEMLQLAQSGAISEQNQQALLDAINEYNKEMANPNVDPIVAAQKLLTVYQSVNDNIKQGAIETRTVLDAQTSGLGQAITNELKKIETQWNNFIAQSQTAQIVKQFVDLTSIIGQITAGMNSLINVFDVWNNQDLSTGEKILQTFMALGMALPILINGFMTLTPTLYGVMVSLGLVKVAEDEVALSATEMWAAMLGPLALVVVAITGVVAAIGLLVSGIKALVDWYNKDANAAAEAAEQAKILTDRYNELDKAAKQLKEDISNYDEAIKALEELTVGTDEYAEALTNANEIAKNLIESLGLYDNYTIENGLIKIDPDALKEAQLEANKNAVEAKNRSYEAKITANQAQVKSDTTNLRREIGSKAWTGAYTNYGFKVTRKFTEDELTQTAEALNKLRMTSEEEYEIAMSSTESFKNVLKTLDGVPDIVLKNLDLVVDNQDAIKDFTDSLYEAINANKFYAKQVMQNAVEDKYGKKINELAKDESGEVNESRVNQISAMLATSNDENTKKMQKELENISTKGSSSNKKLNKNFGYNIKNDEDLARTYAREVLGYSQDEVDKMTYKGHVGAGTLKLADGTKVLDKYNDKKMREQLARLSEEKRIENKYTEQLDANSQLKSIEAIMTGAKTAGQKYGTDFTDSMLNAMTNKGKLNFESLWGDIDPNEVEDLMKLANKPEDLAKAFGLSTENLKAMGYSSVQEFANSFKEGFKNYQWDIDKAIKSSVEKMGGEDVLEEKYDLDSKEVKEYAKHLMEVSDESNKLADSLDTDSDSAALLSKQIIRMNTGVDKLADGFEDWSSILKKSDKSSQEYCDALNEMQDAIADLLDTEDDYITDDFIQKHMKDIEKASKGDADAIDRLHKALAEDIVIKIAKNNDGSIIDGKQIDIDIKSLKDKLNKLELPNLKVGASIDQSKFDADTKKFIDDMMEIVQKAHMTADEANEFFAQMGYHPTFKTHKETITSTVPETTTESEITSIFPLKMTSSTYQSGTREIQQTVDVPDISADGEGSYKGITNLTRKATGSYNNYSSLNKGGKGPGKDSRSKNEPKKEEKLDEEADRYHQIDTQIAKVDKSLSKLQSQTEKYVGAKLIENLNEQWDLLNTQIENYNEKLKIAQQEQKELRSELAAQGVQFNADGTISNYMQAFQAQENAVNKLIAQYNKLSAKQQEKWDEAGTIDNAKERFNEFKENMDRYDELVSDFIPELQQNIQDAVDEQIDLRIQEFNMEIEIRLNMAEAERDWNEFKKRVIDGIKEDDILGNARARLLDFSSYYNAEGTGQVQALTKQVNGLLDQLREQDSSAAWATAYGDNRAQALEDLKDYYDQLRDSLTDILDLQEEIHEAYLDMIDEAADKFGEQVEMYETVRDLIEHDMNVIELVYGEEAYGQLSKYYERQEENYNKQLDFQRQQKDFWYAQMQTMEEGSEEWEAAKENWLEAVDEWNSAVEEAIENLQDKYLNAINEIFQKLNDEVTAGKGLDYVNQEWDLINKNAEQYLDTVDATWGIQKLENKYLDAYDQTDSIQARRQIKKIMDEELANLREQDKLTQYDIDRANMRYDIMLKQIALQEAQQNKSQMRLRRDSQGNYTYQFVADDDEVGALQDELGDLYNSLYDFDKEQYQNNLNSLYDMWVEFQEAMTEAAQINDPVARAERELLIREQYEPLLNGILQENLDIRNNLTESAFDDLAYLYEEDAENFQAMTGAEKDAFLADLIPAWTSGIQQMADAMTAEGGFLPTVKDSLDDINQATQDYEDGLVELQEQAGQTFGDIADNVDDTIDRVNDLIQNNDDLVQSYEDQLDAIRSIVDELNELIEKYKNAETAAKAATEAAYKYWLQEQNKNANAASKNASSITSGGSGTSAGVSSSSSSGSSSSGGGSSGSGNGDGRLSTGDTATYSGKYYYDSYGSGPTGNKYSGVANGVTIDIVNNNPYGVHIRSTDGKYKNLGWVKKSQLSGYDTGGYTGEWGPGGKIALLHQKELVLNATDTRNILDAVNIMRNISGAMLDKLSAATANLNNGIQTGAMEQNVHIDANFPNVQSSHEIEDAINNLMNVASQRINRRG